VSTDSLIIWILKLVCIVVDKFWTLKS